ncbi:hypothetical protein HY213_05270 [Candidatus Peregrinibacteria bacterium]|nr:hypothetical protein [Candidatus Peregrinibacteria bacterium]
MPIPVHQKEDAKNWIDSQLKRSKDQKGLNHVDALLYAVAHGGTLISHAAYDAWAKKDPSVYEDKTWTWYFHDLLEAMSSGFAPYGDRRRGRANRCERDADRRGAYRGGRVAGLRVQIS